MLTIHDFANATYQPWPGSDHLPEGATWIDANSPTQEEKAFLKRALDVEAPSLEAMREILHSSRFYRMGEAICVTVPLPKHETETDAAQHPLALILTPHALLTVRYEHLRPCSPEYLEEIGVDRKEASAVGAAIGVFDGIIDHISDELELLTARLDGYSRQIFAKKPKGGRSGLQGQQLRAIIAEIGRQRQFHSLIEEALLMFSRAIPYIEAQLGSRLEAAQRAQFDRIARDVESLAGHETRLSDKIQFLLDASLGLIGIEQNDIFKVLTIVSVIGIPPTLIASMYGMNFKNIPEYDWTYGYAYGLFLIFSTALLPLVWFRWKKWI